MSTSTPDPRVLPLLETTWAKTLFKRPLVEIRRGISLGFDPPKEDSSVLALTAPSGKYVDTRFLLKSGSKSSFVQDPHGLGGYATAGLSTITILPGSETCVPYECVTHVQWNPSINSSGNYESDGADMYLLANQDVMEVGYIEVEGKVRMFKEYWIGPPAGAKQLPCLVLELKPGPDGKAEIDKGMAIRIGDFVQAVLQTENDFWVERWEVVERKTQWTPSRWNNTKGEILPCAWLMQEERNLGDTVTIDGRKWEVIEYVGS